MALAQNAPAPIGPHAFDPSVVDQLAMRLSKAPFAPGPVQNGAAAGIDYDTWRKIRFRQDRTVWANDAGSLFRLQYFPTGYLFREPVRLFTVNDGMATPILFDPDDFDVPPSLADAVRAVGGISGFRMQSPINHPGVFDEVFVFQGASYFRSLGKGDGWGLSARGIALGAGQPREEFPGFRAFWIEKPQAGVGSVRVHALLDGPSISGAYHFTITPGENTVFDTEARLYPRLDIANAGVAAQTSMFLFGAVDHAGVDDFRNAVHDSDGLQVWTADGERIWRPLTRPKAIRFTTFEGDAPRGFGLGQRARRFSDYNDLEARYDRRPSIWVEPVGDWGPGAVHLVELPADNETRDNIAAFWRPAQPWKAGEEVRIAYRMSWGETPAPQSDLAVVASSRAGKAWGGDDQLFVVDFRDVPPGATGVHAEVVASRGDVGSVSVAAFDDRPLMRAGFRFTPPASGSSELRLRLIGDAGPLSESWRFPWTS